MGYKVENKMNYFSQVGQDKFIDEYFFGKSEGFFVDIGAHDPVEGSNSYFFESQRGWSGICIEPQYNLYKKLKENRSCICLNCAVSDENKISEFYTVDGYSNALSGLVDKYDQKHLNRINNEILNHGGKINKTHVVTKKLQDIFDEHGVKEVDFCSIDTEGSELIIIKSIDFSRTKIKLFCVENNYQTDDVKKYLEETGMYKLHTKIQWDDVFVLNIHN
jgi:FkbM family methyltransferase